MSRVLLIAADHPLPLCDRQEERTTTVTLPDLPDLGEKAGGTISFTGLQGFRVSEHAYYLPAVRALGHSMKPYQYELELESHDHDLHHLLDYLRGNCSPGETVELWNLWVGVDQDDPLFYFYGPLSDFDMETLRQFLNPLLERGRIGQCRMTVTI